MNEPEWLPTVMPIAIKVYPSEARLLEQFVRTIRDNVHELQCQSSNTHIVLAEWYNNKYLAAYFRIRRGSPNIAKKLDIPLSVARILMTEMTNSVIPESLNMVLGQIHRQLTNRNFLPQ